MGLKYLINKKTKKTYALNQRKVDFRRECLRLDSNPSLQIRSKLIANNLYIPHRPNLKYKYLFYFVSVWFVMVALSN